jgi:hypothetical protein
MGGPLKPSFGLSGGVDPTADGRSFHAVVHALLMLEHVHLLIGEPKRTKLWLK